MNYRGRPVLGAISGFFLGAFVALDLQQFSVRVLDNLSVIGLPLIGLVLGLLVGLWAPFGRRGAVATQPTRAPGDAPREPEIPPD